ncbi:hypothetical protein D3C80_1882200 [compost metagenome]
MAGMNNAYMSLGNIFGPAIAGTIYDVHIDAPYMLGALVLVLSLYISMRSGRVTKTAAHAG